MSTNIDAIRQLLTGDLRRIRDAEDAIEDLDECIDRWAQVKDESDLIEHRADLHRHRQVASEARQSFAARTELLHHVDLDGLTVDDIVHQVVTAPGGGTSPATPGEARTLPPTGQAVAVTKEN